MNYDDFLKLKEVKPVESIRVKKRPMKRRGKNAVKPKGEHITNKTIYKREKEFDYLKYYGLVERWICNKYDIAPEEFHCISALYSEEVFNKQHYRLFARAFLKPMEKNIERFMARGFIEKVDMSKYDVLKKKWRVTAYEQLYRLTTQGKHIVITAYKKLEMKETIPIIPWNIHKMKSNFLDRVVIEFNDRKFVKDKGAE